MKVCEISIKSMARLVTKYTHKMGTERVTEISDVNLSAFIYRLFRDNSPQSSEQTLSKSLKTIKPEFPPHKAGRYHDIQHPDGTSDQ